MKPAILATLLIATLVLATPALADSDTLIGPGDAFLLGGEQSRPIHVVGRNRGPVTDGNPVRGRGQARRDRHDRARKARSITCSAKGRSR